MADPDEAAAGPSVLVSIRTGTNTASCCVGTLHLRLGASLADVRQQLTALASASRRGRRKRGDSEAEPPRPPPPATPPPPPLTQEQRERLARIRLHPFDFTSPFQFVLRGGVQPVPRHSEGVLPISSVFPVKPDLGDRRLCSSFCMPAEVEVVTLKASEEERKRRAAAREAAQRRGDRQHSPKGAGVPPFNIDLDPSPGIPDVLQAEQRRRSAWRPVYPSGTEYAAYACVFVRQGDGTDSVHSEKVVMERLLMQNNVFGRQQTPQQLGTLINKYNANTRDFMGRTILQECAQEGNYYVVAFLLGLSFVDVDARDWRGQTALHLAVDRGHLEVLSLLLDANADILATDQCGRTPLHIALERRADVLVTRLCARLHAGGVSHDTLRRCRLTDTTPTAERVLCESYDDACRLYPEVVQRLWAAGWSDSSLRADWAHPDQRATAEGLADHSLREYMTAKGICVRLPVPEFQVGDKVRVARKVRFRSGRGVDPGAVAEVIAVPDGPQWFTPPVRQGCIAKVKVHGVSDGPGSPGGAVFDARPADIQTEAAWAAPCASKDPVELFAELSPDFSSLCRDGQLQALKALWQHYLFDRRAALERGMNGRTALHEAADCCQQEVVEFLLDVVGFDVHAHAGLQDETRRTPMHLAAQRGATDIVRRLYVQGMEPNAKDINLCTPLHTALYHKRWHTAEFLLTEVKEIEVDFVDAAGHTPLHIAAASNLYSVCELLLVSHQCNVSLRGEAVAAACPRLPAADVLRMEAAQRHEFAASVRRRERRWRLRSWRAKWTELRRDPADGRLKRFEKFESAAQWDQAARRPPLRELVPVAELRHAWKRPWEYSTSRRCALSLQQGSEPVLVYHQHHSARGKHGPKDLLLWVRKREDHGGTVGGFTRQNPVNYGELAAPHYRENPYVASGLGWMRPWRGALVPRPPVVELTLRRPEREYGVRAEFGVEWGEGMVVDRVQPGGWADRCGLGHYAQLDADGRPRQLPQPCGRWARAVYRADEVRREVQVHKDRDGQIGVEVGPGGLIRRVLSGGPAEAAGLSAGLRVVAVNGHRPSGTARLSPAEGALDAALAAAESPLTLTVAAKVRQPQDIDGLDATAVEVRLVLGRAPGWRERLPQPRRPAAELRSVQGMTPLACAVTCGRDFAATALLLLENGAGKARSDTPQVVGAIAARAIDDSNFEVAVHLLRLLRRAEAGDAALMHRYVDSGNHAAVRWLVEQGAPLDRPGVGKFAGMTPVAVASKKGDHRCVTYLLQQGADPGSGTIMVEPGTSPAPADPLLVGIAEGHEDVVSLLIHFGARLNEPGPPPLCRTPLHAACALGNLEMVKGLVGQSADVNALCRTPGAGEATSLWVALEEGPPRVRCGGGHSALRRRRATGAASCGTAAALAPSHSSQLPVWMQRRPPKMSRAARSGPAKQQQQQQQQRKDQQGAPRRGADSFEAIAVFLCERSVDLAAGGKHPLDYVDLAASKGYWEAASAVLALLQRAAAGAPLDRPPPYSDAPAAGAGRRAGHPAPAQIRRSPAEAWRRDAVSFAAQDNKGELLRRLLVDWGVRPSPAPGRDGLNAADRAFRAGDLDSCLLLLARGIFPTRPPAAADRDTRALAGAVSEVLDPYWRPRKAVKRLPAVGASVGAIYSSPALPPPPLPVNPLTFSAPALLTHVPRVGQRVQVLREGQGHSPGVVIPGEDGVSVQLDDGTLLHGLAADEEARLSYEIAADCGHTLAHALAARGLRSHLSRFLHCTRTHWRKDCRFDPKIHDRGSAAGTLLYAAVFNRQGRTAEMLIDEWGARAAAAHGKSPLVAAVAHADLPMVRKLVESAQPDLNYPAVPEIPAVGTHAQESLRRAGLYVESHSVTPLYLAAAMLNLEIVSFLLRHPVHISVGRYFLTGATPDRAAQSPLHACLCNAPPCGVVPAASALAPKRGHARCADAAKIAALLCDAARSGSPHDLAGECSYAPSGRTQAKVPTHVLNIAARKGYWEVVGRLLAAAAEPVLAQGAQPGAVLRGAAGIERAVHGAVLAVAGEEQDALVAPHVVHFLAQAGELQLLRLCLKGHQQPAGAPDVCLPPAIAEHGPQAVLRLARGSTTHGQARGVGTTADWAAWAGQAGALVLLLCRGSRLSRLCSDLVPAGHPRLRFCGLAPRPGQVAGGSGAPPRRSGRRGAEARGLPPSAPRRVRGDGWDAHAACLLLGAVDEVESAAGGREGWNYLHYCAVRGSPAAPAAAALLIEAWKEARGPRAPPGAADFARPIAHELIGTVTPLWMAARCNNPAVAQVICKSLAGAPGGGAAAVPGRSPLPWAVMHRDEGTLRAALDLGADCNAPDDLWLPSACRGRRLWRALRPLAAAAFVPFASAHVITTATPAFLACLSGNEDTARLLRAHGADFSSDASLARPLLRRRPPPATRSRVRPAGRDRLGETRQSDDDSPGGRRRGGITSEMEADARRRHLVLAVRQGVGEMEPEDKEASGGVAREEHRWSEAADALIAAHGNLRAAFAAMQPPGRGSAGRRSARGARTLAADSLRAGLRQAGVSDDTADRLTAALCGRGPAGLPGFMAALDWTADPQAPPRPVHRPWADLTLDQNARLWQPAWACDERDLDDADGGRTSLAIPLRPIWAVVDGAPNHPLKITVKKKLEAGTPRSHYDPASKRKGTSLREACERYIRLGRYVVTQCDGLRGLSSSEITLLILVAATKGHWEIAALILKEAAEALRSRGGEGGAAAPSRFLCEVAEPAARVFRHLTKRHPIHVAAEHAGRDLFALFLNKTQRDDIEHLPDPRGYSALHCAILVSNVGVVELLIKRGVDLEKRGGPLPRLLRPGTRPEDVAPDMTALMLAARVNNLTVVTQLLSAGAAKDAVDSAGNTPLAHACEMGHLAIVEALVSAQADIAVANRRGYTALMRACVRGHDDVACPLLQYWTHTSGLASQTTSVLHCAAEGGCDGVVELLVSGDWDHRSIQVLEKDRNGPLHPLGSQPNSPIWIAWALGRTLIKRDLHRLLRKKDEEGCPEVPEGPDVCLVASMAAAQQDGAPAVGAGAEPEATLLPGWLRDSLLMAERIRAKLSSGRAAASTQQALPTELTYAAGVPALRDYLRLGCTLLRFKPHERARPIQELGSMGQQGPHRELRLRSRGWSLLEWAARANHAIAVKVLGDHCLADTCDALHLAAERGNLDIVQILLQLQMSGVSAQDSRGRTALMRAIAARKEKVALFLMTKTQSKRLLRLTPDGQSLLHLCASAGLEEAVTHMLGCLIQLERRLRGGEDNLSLHDFIHAPDRHPGLCDYDSEEEEEEPTEGSRALQALTAELVERYGSVRSALSAMGIDLRRDSARMECGELAQALRSCGLSGAAVADMARALPADRAGCVDLRDLLTQEARARRVEAERAARESAVPLSGFTPFEYALMFGHHAVALRIAFGSTQSQQVGSSAPPIPLNPRFPGPAGCELPVMSASVRAMVSEFFDDPSRGPNAGPFVIRGDLVKHPAHSKPSEETGKWPRDPRRVRFARMTWPDVRVVGLARMRETQWIADKLDEILTLDHERQRYHALLDTLDLHGRAFRLNYTSLSSETLTPADRLMVLQHVASSLIVGRYTQRDHDWTRSPADGGFEEVIGVEQRGARSPKAPAAASQERGSRQRSRAAERLAVSADGLAGQISCVQLEYTEDRANVGVSVDDEGVVHERFTLVDDGSGRRVMISGDVDQAVETHFRRREAEAKRDADRVLAHVARRLRTSGSPLLQHMRVAVDWRSVDRYRFAAPRDRIRALEELSTNRGLWAVLAALDRIAPGIGQLEEKRKRGKAKGASEPAEVHLPVHGVPAGQYSQIIFRRALWDEAQRQFFVSEEARDEARRTAGSELVVHFDAQRGEVRFTRPEEALRPLLAVHAADEARQELERMLEELRVRLEPVLDLKCKVEHEGGWAQQTGAAAAPVVSPSEFARLLADLEEELVGMMSLDTPPGKRRERGDASVAPSVEPSPARGQEPAKWLESRTAGGGELSLASLLRSAARQHLRSIGILISPRREPTCKLAAAPNRTLIACVRPTSAGLALPSGRQIRTAVVSSVMEQEISRLREQMSLTLSDVQQRLQTYLPSTTLVVDWRSFDELDLADRFAAHGVFCHGRGQRVLNPLVSGMSVGWDSKLGAVVRKHVAQITVHCSRAETSVMELTATGQLHYYAALLAECAGSSAGCSPGAARSTPLLSTQEIASEAMILLERREEALHEELLRRDPRAAPPDRSVSQHVDAARAFPCWCTCEGGALRRAAAGEPHFFTINARNILNRPCAPPQGAAVPEPFAVRIVRASRGRGRRDARDLQSAVEVEVALAPQAHAQYRARFVAPQRAGWYQVHVSLTGIPVARSPFSLYVAPAPKVARIALCEEVTAVVRGRPALLRFACFDRNGNRCGPQGRLPRPLRALLDVAAAAQRGRKEAARYTPALAAALRWCGAAASCAAGELAVRDLTVGWDGLRFRRRLSPPQVAQVASACRDSCKVREVPSQGAHAGEDPPPRQDWLRDGLICLRSKNADARFTAGPVQQDGGGTFSVRVVPGEVGQLQLSICLSATTPNGEPITATGADVVCELSLDVLSSKEALLLAQERTLAGWEQQALRRYAAEQEKHRTWFTDPHRNETRPPRDPHPSRWWQWGLRRAPKLRAVESGEQCHTHGIKRFVPAASEPQPRYPLLSMRRWMAFLVRPPSGDDAGALERKEATLLPPKGWYKGPLRRRGQRMRRRKAQLLPSGECELLAALAARPQAVALAIYRQLARNPRLPAPRSRVPPPPQDTARPSAARSAGRAAGDRSGFGGSRRGFTAMADWDRLLQEALGSAQADGSLQLPLGPAAPPPPAEAADREQRRRDSALARLAARRSATHVPPPPPWHR